MSRIHALRGVRAAAIPLALLMPAGAARPTLNSTNFSPKASLSYDPNKDWNVTANFGEARRYPTVAELYQNVSSGGTSSCRIPCWRPSMISPAS